MRRVDPETLKLYYVDKFSEGDSGAFLEALRMYSLTDLDQADVVYCASIDKMPGAKEALRRRKIPLVVYCWDYYIWAHEGRHHHWNWGEYAEFLKYADLVFVPSHGQQRRLRELLGINSVVVRSGVTTYDLPISDEGFVLDPVRYYPEENKLWVVRACEELQIPVIHSEHQYSLEDFRKLVASCSFLTCGYREASTGGLPLIEGLYLGKPALVSNSPYMGARDYLGTFGNYFQFDDYQDLKKHIHSLWSERPKLDVTITREYINHELSYRKMAEDIGRNICAHLSK